MAFSIETDRLLLRDPVDADFDTFFAHICDDDHWRHLPMDPPTRDSVRDIFELFREAQYAEPRQIYFLLAFDKSSQSFVGEASLERQSFVSRQGSLGWGVAAHLCGQGFATEIGNALLHLAFDRLDLHRVEAQCRVNNEASRRVMVKLGMREEGLFRDNVLVRGEWWSTAQYAILSTDR
jgi:RimJ/RimL family protein N-acetyltransferase